jgi:hypothetical protein
LRRRQDCDGRRLLAGCRSRDARVVRRCFRSSPHEPNELLRLRGRFDIEVLTETPSKLLVRGDRASTISQAVEQLKQLSKRALVLRHERDRSSSPNCRTHAIAGSLLRLGDVPRAAKRTIAKARSFPVEPTLELGCVGDEESGQQGSPIQLECRFRIARVDQALELGRITLDDVAECELVVAAADDRVVA